MDPQTRSYIDRKAKRANDKIQALDNRLDNVVATALDYRPRHFVQEATNVPAGNSTLAISWSPPITTPSYVVVPTVITGPSHVGTVFAAVQNNSQTASGCTLLIRNATAGAVSAGLDVAIHPMPTTGL